MREKVKIGVFAVSIFYSVIIVILALTSYATSVSEIELVDSEENAIKLEQYEKELYSLPQNSCTNTINEMIKYYKKTSFNGNVNLKNLLNETSTNTYSSFFSDIKETCDIREAQEDYYANNILSVGLFYEKIQDKYWNQYEIGLTDWLVNGALSVGTTGVEYHIIKNTELELISNLIDNAKRGDLINE